MNFEYSYNKIRVSDTEYWTVISIGITSHEARVTVAKNVGVLDDVELEETARKTR
jgi:hypothetical protein